MAVCAHSHARRASLARLHPLRYFDEEKGLAAAHLLTSSPLQVDPIKGYLALAGLNALIKVGASWGSGVVRVCHTLTAPPPPPPHTHTYSTLKFSKI